MRWLVMALFVGCGPGSGPTDTGDTADTGASTELLGIGLSPNSPVVGVGETLSFTAKAFYADTTNEVINDQVTWAVTEPRVAEIDQNGTATGLGMGVTDVVATDASGVSAKVQLTVNASDAVPTSVVLSPSSLVLQVGEVVEIEAIANFPDGSAGNVSATCTFTSDHPAILALTGADARGVAAGETTVRATCDSQQASASARVEAEGTSTGLPDLRISDALVSARSGGIDVVIEVENAGSATADGFFIDLFLDPAQPPTAGADFDETLWVGSLGVGQSRMMLGTLTGVSTGSHQVWAYVDADEWVDESDDSNNRAGPLEVTLAGTGSSAPQLEITTFEAVSDGTYTLYELQIRNAGQQPANGFWIDLWYDRTTTPEPCTDGDDYLWVSTLAPGATVTWEPDVTGGPWLWLDSVVFVDSCLDVTESNESDNIDTLTVWPE